MEVIRALDACPRPPAGTAVTIGAYDGVHLGHQAVIAEVRRRAEAHEGGPLATAVVTFDRHPAMVVRPESAPLLLTDLDQKLELLEAAGVDYTLVIHFDEARSREEAPDFVHRGARRLPRRPPRRGGGGLPLRQGAQGRRGPARADGERPRVRRRRPRPGGGRRQAGGHRRGPRLVHRDPGRPPGRRARRPPTGCSVAPTRCGGSSATATTGAGSSASPPPTSPCPATSSCRPTASTPGGSSGPTASVHPAAISLGRRPTFYEQAHASLLEAHLLDFDGDLYGEHVRVRFQPRLRGEVQVRLGRRPRRPDQPRTATRPGHALRSGS